ncbi:hypothetical protein E3_0800 [Rhodococcus phage E3]|uniref:hypothetical protein n=1 Tax=Rhodococcus phage E3 TaxID=1007869 RepID=UPI0002C69A34|nr:hypothetical protein M176_gp084 [Rhodococcus phage E3]AEQ20993.1 hypothetical protein E3_0800 [Rhodococcus phage E3]
MSNTTAAPIANGTVVELAVHPRLAAARAKRGVVVDSPRFTVVGSRPRPEEIGGGFYYDLKGLRGALVKGKTVGGVSDNGLIVIDKG